MSGTTIIYCLYYYPFSIHFRDHLAIILNVTVGFLSLLYLVLFSFGFEVIGFLSLLYPYYVLIMSLLFPTFVLFPISACSFFALLVPFLPLKGTTLTSSLYLFYLPCVFFTQNLFQKRHNPCFHPLIPLGHNYYCLFMFVVISILFFLI